MLSLSQNLSYTLWPINSCSSIACPISTELPGISFNYIQMFLWPDFIYNFLVPFEYYGYLLRKLNDDKIIKFFNYIAYVFHWLPTY